MRAHVASARPKASASLRAEVVTPWTLGGRAVAAAPADGVLLVTGPPGSGKTTALATRAMRLAGDVALERSSSSIGTRPPKSVLVICSHEPGVRAFRAALAGLGASADICVDTAPSHALGMLRSHYALAGVRPDVRAGGELASRAIVREAAVGLLDLTWPELREGEVDINLPFLSRPDKFLDEAAALIRQLRAGRVSPEEFERASVSGLSLFYGDEVEAAIAKCRDPDLQSRLSRRGREALRAIPAVLQQQRRAERDLGLLLARLYREYLRAARTAPLLSDEDIVDECVRWLVDDAASARAIASGYAGAIVDDAEDAHGAASDLVVALMAAGLPGLTLAGWSEAALDGIQGRRSALAAMEPTERIALAPPAAAPQPGSHRFDGEAEEVAQLALSLDDLLRQGTAPDEIAVLTRSADAAAIYADLLERRGLPTDAPLDRLAAPHDIADWLALCAVVDDSSDHEHLLRVLASPLLGLSDASVYALCEDPAAVTQLALDVGVGDERKRPGSERQRTALARNMLEGTVDARLPQPARDLIVRFREQLAVWRARFTGIQPAAAIAQLARAGGFITNWNAAPGHRRLRLLEDFARVVEAFAADRAGGSQRTLNQLVRAFEDGALPVRSACRSSDAIVCDTIAGAKGERWPHIFVVGLAHERFPRVYVSRPMAFSRTYGLIVRENVAPGAAQTAKFAWYYARFNAKALYLAEEARALKYGLSRGTVTASASGFGKPPRWAKDYDLLLVLGQK
jgi:superfamily I DNA/RNA helicase